MGNQVTRRPDTKNDLLRIRIRSRDKSLIQTGAAQAELTTAAFARLAAIYAARQVLAGTLTPTDLGAA